MNSSRRARRIRRAGGAPRSPQGCARRSRRGPSLCPRHTALARPGLYGLGPHRAGRALCCCRCAFDARITGTAYSTACMLDCDPVVAMMGSAPQPRNTCLCTPYSTIYTVLSCGAAVSDYDAKCSTASRDTSGNATTRRARARRTCGSNVQHTRNGEACKEYVLRGCGARAPESRSAGTLTSSRRCRGSFSSRRRPSRRTLSNSTSIVSVGSAPSQVQQQQQRKAARHKARKRAFSRLSLTLRRRRKRRRPPA